MNRKLLVTILQYIVFLGLGVAIIFYMSSQLSDEQKNSMMAAIQGVRIWLLVPIFIAGFLSHYVRALRWKLLLQEVDICPSTTNTTFAVLIGYITNLVLPRAGEVAKCTVLARYEKVPADKMIGTIVAERAFDVLCLLIITFTAFLLQADVIGDYATDLLGKVSEKTNVFVFVLIAGLLMIVTLVLVYRRFRDSKIGKFIKGLSDGVKSILNLKTRGKFIIYTILLWGLYWILVWIGFWSMDELDHLSGSCALVVLVFGSIGMIATQGGIGAYPYLVGKILLFYNIAEAHGLAFGWVSWTVQTGIVVVLGVISLILLPIYNNNRANAKASVDTKQDS
ncbi:MAG: flippase-like domain-containing protein [Chitinophagales bacterium]|nr:flippase-like domain-containing protein [Chitinophagaceae bacterium]MCB9063811.1 flippase-like domain-containing protein [Chitinophagales bacterium]